MENTGERHILNQVNSNESEYYIHLMHLATYQFALKYIKGKHVLDYGCGSGYGSHMLASSAASVAAVDLSEEAIQYAKDCYKQDNLVFKTISELSQEKYDVITSFQVIEHVPADKEYIYTLKCLLKPGGCLLISTPDRINRLYNYIQKPWNVFHLKEYSANSLDHLLKSNFKKVEILHIGSESDFILKEISRTKKQKVITLPCTLFFYPYVLRVFLLNFQSAIFKTIKKYLKGKRVETKYPTKQNFESQFSIEDIIIAENVKLSTDLLAICFN